MTVVTIRKKVKKAELAKMSQVDAVLALNSKLSSEFIILLHSYFSEKGKKGDYNQSDKLLAGCVCWELISEGHSKAHVAKAVGKHETWVDTVIKKAVNSRSRYIDDHFAFMFLASSVEVSDVILISKSFYSTDFENKKIAVKLFDFYVMKNMVLRHQLIHFFDYVLIRKGVVTAPFTGLAYDSAKAALAEREHQLRKLEFNNMVSARRGASRWPLGRV